MSINGLPFLGFLLAALTVYYLVPGRFQWMVLLAAGTWFYLSASGAAAVYLALTILLTYGAGLGMDALTQRMKAAQAGAADRRERARIKQIWVKRKRLLLTAVLCLNFLSLFVFKYAASCLGGVNDLLARLNAGMRLPVPQLLLPLGISFYTFQTLGYLIDLYRGKYPPERNLLRYALFASYFPQMIQGPINRYSELQPQLTSQHRFDAACIRDGILLMMWGMLKKVFIADTLAPGVSEIYENYGAYSGAVTLLGSALYCIQLYCDFSGGVDVVRGASQLFGIEMAENFRRPYFATSLDDFWRRWHISLGEWMKDYLFYPMALSPRMTHLSKRIRGWVSPHYAKLFTPCAATLVVFLVVGVWQGPGLSNLAYGLWNGLIMSGAMLFASSFHTLREKLGLREDSRSLQVFRILRTCLLVIIGRYFSRSATLGAALGMLGHTVGAFFRNFTPGELVSFGLGPWDYAVAALGCAILFYVSFLQEKGVAVRQALSRRPAAVQFAVVFAGVLLLIGCVYLNSDYTAIAYVYENV